MQYMSVKQAALRWNLSERSVRNYCASGRVNGAFLAGKTWLIPIQAEKPERSRKKENTPKSILDILQDEKRSHTSGGLYHKIKAPLSEKLIKKLHFILKTGTSDSQKAWFAVGEYKKMPNEVGGRETTLPENVSEEMKKLLTYYNGKKT